MWKRDEAVRPSASRETNTPPSSGARLGQFDNDLGKIGKSVLIKGQLSGSEDLTIEGNVEGTIELRDNVLTIGPNGQIHAQISAKVVVIHGEVKGNVTAAEKIEIRDSGSMEGDITAPRIAIAEGALFRGSVDMQRASQPTPVATAPVAGATSESKAAVTASSRAAAQRSRVGA